ncbi:hypothetical protein [Caenispirillum bisanense]|uniref:Haemolysin XhlA n=1 Tax=Caenispirillum bisanense TaxID=414052 RepID=A0A286GNJ7_9PROT|nr:hypothetical protein [Caenispirillum bisanense]SOD96639.1 hypothetical protein SAMN05421508_10617 [Caenispirillum bisanense]
MTESNERLAALETDVRHIRLTVDKIAALTEKVVRLDERMIVHAEQLADLAPRVEALESWKWRLVGMATVIPIIVGIVARQIGLA